MRRSTIMAAAIGLAAALAAPSATADALRPAGMGEAERAGETPGSLMGRTASFKALAYDDPEKPLFDGFVHTAPVTDGIEFGMGPEGVQNNLDVVPAIVDVSANRIEVSFELAGHPGYLVEAAFNGYLLAFEPECLVIDSAAVDPAWSTVALDEDDLIFEGRTLKINLAGRPYDATSRIGIDLTVDDCPMS